jgi:hypothetical protein
VVGPVTELLVVPVAAFMLNGGVLALTGTVIGLGAIIRYLFRRRDASGVTGSTLSFGWSDWI